MTFNFIHAYKKIGIENALIWLEIVFIFTNQYFEREKAMLTSKIKLISTVVIGTLLLPLTVHAAVISNQTFPQDMSSLALLALGASGLALGRRLEKQ